MMTATDDPRLKARQWGWTLLLLAGICVVAAVCNYATFYAAEREGRSVRTSRRVGSVYETFGKDGFLWLFGGSAIGCGIGAAWRMSRGYTRPSSR